MASNAYAQGNATDVPTPPQLGGPASSTASPPPASGTSPTPPASSFNEYCERKGAERKVEKTAKDMEKAFGFTLNTSISVMAQLKEIATSPALECAPGLRQVAGCCLHILETVGQMRDNVAAFNQLASQSYDNCMLLLTCMEIIDDKTDMAQKAKDKLNETALEFYRVMDNILKAMKGLNSRSKFTRFVFAKADKNDLDKHRSAMNHLVNKLQIVLHLANLAKKGGGSENKTIKQLTEQDVHKAAEGYRAILVKRAEDEYNRQVAEYNHYVTITTNATANFNAGDNSNVYKSGNVSTKIISGQNDYSTNTNTVTITNGNFGADAFSKKRDRPRDRRDTRGWSDSDDSDGRDAPRARRERQRRDTDYERGHYDDRRY